MVKKNLLRNKKDINNKNNKKDNNNRHVKKYNQFIEELKKKNNKKILF